ncbi:DUF3267 domain-containing protein [Enterococcus sp. AZ109]|uniref:DUF3267 domain-containing protein n=1 Tax=Enterococcus sp. AZ109 TaxID=2774634 RepID=UPI003F1FD2DF
MTIEKMLLDTRHGKREVTFSSTTATIVGLLYALPFIVVIGFWFRFVLSKRASLMDIGGMRFFLVFLLIIVVSVIIHEFLHGLGWVLAGKLEWNQINYGFTSMMPYCACKSPLKKKAYLIGAVLPLMILGLVSLLLLLVIPSTVTLLIALVNFTAAGGDLLIISKVSKEEKNAQIIDHPTKAGYVVFDQVK